MGRLELFDLVPFDIESGLNGRAFACHHHYLVILIPESWADGSGIAHYESIAMTDHAGHHIASIPLLGRFAEYARHVKFFFDNGTHVLLPSYFIAMRIVDAVVLLIKEVADLFENSDSVGFFLGMLAEIYQLLEELVHIGHVEVASKHEVAGLPVVLTQKWMAVLNAVAPEGAIAQMAEKQFTCEGKIVLEPFGILNMLGVGLELLFEALIDGPEYVLDGRGRVGPSATYVAVTRADVELYVGEARAILSAVMLLLHKEIHLVEPVEACTVLVLVILKWFQQSYKGNSALVFYGIAHRFLTKVQRYRKGEVYLFGRSVISDQKKKPRPADGRTGSFRNRTDQLHQLNLAGSNTIVGDDLQQV